MSNLNHYYFYDQNGDRDILIGKLNCHERLLYLFLKNTKNFVLNMPLTFLSDICYYLSLTTDKNVNLSLTYNYDPMSEQIVITDYKTGKGEKQLSKIITLLKAGEYVAIQPYGKRIPFEDDFIGYDASQVGDGGHMYMAVGYENNCLFLVIDDHEADMTTGLLSKCKDNDSIKIVGIDCLRPSFEIYLNYMTFSLSDNMESISKKECFNEFLQISIKDFERKCEGNNDVYYGKQALGKLIELCDDNDFYFTIQQSVGGSGFNVQDLNPWVRSFDSIRKRRHILLYTLSNLEEISSKALTEVSSIINKDIEQWETAKNILIKRIIQKENVQGKMLKKYIENITQQEIQLFNMLKHM